MSQLVKVSKSVLLVGLSGEACSHLAELVLSARLVEHVLLEGLFDDVGYYYSINDD